MGATVNELTVVSLKIEPGARVTKGQRIAELESDKSVFEFEAPCDGTIRAILVQAGDVKPAGEPFLQIETTDTSLRHLEHKGPGDRGQATGDRGRGTGDRGQETGDKGQGTGDRGQASATGAAGAATKALIWTPRATKLAQEAGLDPTKITDIEATGPGGRVSGDDVTRYLAARK